MGIRRLPCRGQVASRHGPGFPDGSPENQRAGPSMFLGFKVKGIGFIRFRVQGLRFREFRV